MSDEILKDPGVEKTVQTLGIVGMALIAGVALFACVVVFLLSSGAMRATPPAGLPVPLSLLGVALSLPIVAVSFVVKGIVLRGTGREDVQDSPLERIEAALARFRIATILAMAMCEGASMLVLVFVLVAGEPFWALGVLFPVFGMLLHFPARLKIDQWLTEVRREG